MNPNGFIQLFFYAEQVGSSKIHARRSTLEISVTLIRGVFP